MLLHLSLWRLDHFFHVYKIWTKIFFYYSRTKPWLLGNFIWTRSSEKLTGLTLLTYRPRSTSAVTLDTSHPRRPLVAEPSSRTVNSSPKKLEFRGKRQSVCKYSLASDIQMPDIWMLQFSDDIIWEWIFYTCFLHSGSGLILPYLIINFGSFIRMVKFKGLEFYCLSRVLFVVKKKNSLTLFEICI